MTRIRNLCEQIADEICSAKEYAEEYLLLKSKGASDRAKVYHTMANQELEHSTHLHTIATSEIEELSKVYTPPAEMQKEWEHTHKVYVEKTSWIKTMLQM